MRRANLWACAGLTLAAGVALSTASGAQPSEDRAAPGVLVSRQLMDRRQLHVGDVVRLSADPSGARSRVFRILDSYEPTPDPMRFAQPALEARLHLPDLLALTENPADPGTADTVSSINVALATK